jgi:3-hydroxybutyryl-CoA dehydrogenase
LSGEAKPRISVIGAGLMGHGIAYIFARAGHRVRIHDPVPETLQSLPGRLRAIADLLGDDPDSGAGVEAVAEMRGALAEADYVFEAASENIELKRDLFAEMEQLTGPGCVLATNTSSIPLKDIGVRMTDRSRLVGAHFWNPPHLVPLVEVSQLAAENLAAVEMVIKLLEDAGRHPVHVKRDVPGLIGNRLQHALKREAIALVADGVCDAEAIDNVVKLGFGKRMSVLGPLEQSDLVGLGLTKAIHEVLIPDLDRTPRVQDYLLELVARGKLGMDAGEGFRKWSPEEAAEVRKRLSEFLASEANTKER